MVKNSTEQKEHNTAQQNAESQAIEKRKCKKCGLVKSLDQFHVNKKYKLGRRYDCKDCRNKSRRKTDIKEKAETVKDGYCLCRACGKEKLANNDNFYPSKLSEKSKVLICKNCRRFQNAKTARKNKESARKRHFKWREANRGHVRSYSKARKGDVKRATPKWFERDSVKEVYSQAAKRGWHVDHVVPIKSDIVCGLHCHANLQIMEASINCSKKNKYWPDMPEVNNV